MNQPYKKGGSFFILMLWNFKQPQSLPCGKSQQTNNVTYHRLFPLKYRKWKPYTRCLKAIYSVHLILDTYMQMPHLPHHTSCCLSPSVPKNLLYNIKCFLYILLVSISNTICKEYLAGKSCGLPYYTHVKYTSTDTQTSQYQHSQNHLS